MTKRLFIVSKFALVSCVGGVVVLGTLRPAQAEDPSRGRRPAAASRKAAKPSLEGDGPHQRGLGPEYKVSGRLHAVDEYAVLLARPVAPMTKEQLKAVRFTEVNRAADIGERTILGDEYYVRLFHNREGAIEARLAALKNQEVELSMRRTRDGYPWIVDVSKKR